MILYPSTTILLSLTLVLIICLTFTWSAPQSLLSNKLSFKTKNDTRLLTDSTRLSSQTNKLRNIASSTRDRLKSNRSKSDDSEPENDNNDETLTDQRLSDESQRTNKNLPRKDTLSYVVVLTSLSGVYVWWPSLFGGDDTFHLLFSQDDVPRFHDVTGDEHGNIYLTAPHERTVYRVQYDDGWWISNFSNHSVMNSIRSEMPLFLNIHHVSSILYVYGHSDIQTIDLLERSGARGSAPFMKRLRELSPNLRISDMIIDQLTSEGYIIGDSYGWCTVIRCSLAVSECVFLFKIPSSYDNRPYPCTATIDFSNKIMYLNLEEKILAVYLNEQTHYDRRFVLADKTGPRSTLGYDDIITHNQTVFYTDVLRPLLHICQLSTSKSCVNMSLSFSSPPRTILPLRLSIIQALNLRPPEGDEEEDEAETPDDSLGPEPLMSPNATNPNKTLTTLSTSIESHHSSGIGWHALWILLLGILVGLLISALAFVIYQRKLGRTSETISKKFPLASSIASSIDKYLSPQNSSNKRSRKDANGSKSALSSSSSSDPSQSHLLESSQSVSDSSGSYSGTTTSSRSPLSYDPTAIL